MKNNKELRITQKDVEQLGEELKSLEREIREKKMINEFTDKIISLEKAIITTQELVLLHISKENNDDVNDVQENLCYIQ